ncbi:MAG: class I SAM-dependent methyltransferase [Gammaproteobacteria bacterium]|nr:class I SAM-dependent methyltransferase [Gammaproteobacteria bacterium]
MNAEETNRDANPYHDAELADLYAGFGYEGTYSLVSRDLPGLLQRHVKGKKAVDFACGAGRSTRLLKSLGYDAVGVDVSGEMLTRARRLDPEGDYRLIDEGSSGSFPAGSFDLVLSAFPFSSTNSLRKITGMLSAFGGLVAEDGAVIAIEPTPEFYLHEWLSFTSNFPGNAAAVSGDPVRAAFRERPETPVTDYLWTHEDYLEAFDRAGLRMLEALRPLGSATDPWDWISESRVAPWVIYALSSPAEQRLGP